VTAGAVVVFSAIAGLLLAWLVAEVVGAYVRRRLYRERRAGRQEAMRWRA
jgi:hypothetical protein